MESTLTYCPFLSSFTAGPFSACSHNARRFHLWSYTFSAKEKDVETGLSVTSLRSVSSSSLSQAQTSLTWHSLIRRFGSRYYSSDLSVWLSVDPKAAKYPSLSPYVYCANNPIKLVDPNGEEIGDVDEASRKKIEALTTKGSADYSRAFTRKYNQLAKSKTVYNFKEASQDEITAERRGGVFHNDDGSVDIIHSEGGVRTSTEGGFSYKYATLFEETFHASEFDKGRLDLKNPTCMDEARAWKFATKAPGTNMRWNEIDNGIEYCNFTFAHMLRHLSVKDIANGLKFGFENDYYDSNNRAHSSFGAGGIYKHLKLK